MECEMNVKYRIILLKRTNLYKLTNKSWSDTLTNSESSFSACKAVLLLQKGLAIKEKKRNKRWKAVKHKICKGSPSNLRKRSKNQGGKKV